MIYDTIKALCKKRGLSVTSVEKEAGLSNGAISKWNDSSPTVDKLNAVAKVLNVKVDCLLRQKGEGELMVHGTAGQLREEFAYIVISLLDNFTKEELQDVFDTAETLKEGGGQCADDQSRWNN